MLSRIVLCLGLALAACGGTSTSEPAKPAADTRSLFERLGGLPAITAVVDDFVNTTGADTRINMFFVNTDVPKLKQAMVDQICEGTGGPCKYTGKSMEESHRNMKVTTKDFEVFMEDLEKTLDKFNVPAREKGEVLAAFRTMQKDVVTIP
jgi:hemoglobin